MNTVVYHAALPDDWAEAQRIGEYRISTRGLDLEAVGFIHAAHAHQLDGVIGRFYADCEHLVILSIDTASLTVIDEPASDLTDERFPHIYGAVPMSAVIATSDWYRDRP